MDQLIIDGGVPLKGKISVSGSKNASLPLLFASILFDDALTYHNVPNLMDIRTTVKILKILGCNVEFDKQANIVSSSPGNLLPEAPYDMVKTMRAAVLCLGPLLAKLGQVKVAMPGGCAIGARPIDMHINALRQMGAEFELEHGYVFGKCKQLHGAKIHFDFPTVCGTSNVIMAAVLADGETILENAAREPEIIDLARFLRASGADISGEGESVIRIQGVSRLKGIEYRVMSDRIEAGTFIIAAGITGGSLLVENCPYESLIAAVDKLRMMGMKIEQNPNGLLCEVETDCHLVGTDIETRPYPGFPTDLQPQYMSLATLSEGASIITENIFENRFMHVQELVRMGADIRLSGRSAIVRGVQKLEGAPVMVSDLRAGAALVLAGLAAHGKTTIQRIYHIDRGYERIEEKLRQCGAQIERVKE